MASTLRSTLVGVAVMTMAAGCAQAVTTTRPPTPKPTQSVPAVPLPDCKERLLAAVAERPDGEPALNPFRRLIIDGAAQFSDVNAERIARVAPAIAASPALQIHEREVVARYARQLAELLARETDAQPGDPVPTAVATAMFGAHRAVAEYVRGEVLAGHRGPALAAHVQAQATRVFAVLEAGIADYPPKVLRSSRRHS
jgi:hypothetical protein